MHPTLFGTDGVRTRVGNAPLTITTLSRLGLAIGAWIKKEYGAGAQIIIAHDTRQSCSFIKTQLMASLLTNDCTIYDVGVLSTPGACFLVEHTKRYDCGIMISASHNPYDDNGIKIFAKGGKKLSPADESFITQAYYDEQSTVDYKNFGTVVPAQPTRTDYLNALQQLTQPGFLTGKRIILDCAHGAVSEYAEYIFKQTGADVITLHNQPNGTNINHDCGAVHPTELQAAVLEHKADIGFAFDGDGDRITAVNNLGHVKDGDDILALLLQHPTYQDQQIIVGTVMTNQGLQTWLGHRHKSLIRTPVGDKFITQELITRNALLGGETSGHIIMRDFIHCSDGIAVALRICQTIQATNNWSMATFNKMPNILVNIPVSRKISLEESPLHDLILATKAELPEGRVLVRYSGTEPVLRVMIESYDMQHTQSVINHFTEQLSIILKKET